MKKEEQTMYHANLRRILYGKETTRYDKTRKFLSEYGADYLLHHEVDPVEYMLLKLLIAVLLGGMALVSRQYIMVPVFAVIGFMIVPAMLKMSNAADNKEILPEIKAIYNTLAIKTEAGVFLTDTLSECRYVVKNKRLKEAILALNAEILVKNDIAEPVLRFNRKFRNQYIDSFCIFLEQALESGQILQILADMTDQLEDVQKALYEAEKKKLDMQVMKVELMIFGMVLATIGYYVVYMMSAVAGELL